jgi:O-antigen/teichoic acid export membrane protein
MIREIKKRINKLEFRSLNIIQHIGWSIIYKIGSIIANFIMVPLSIKYLGIEDYGIWLTLSSFLTWFILFDIGLGNGLRNKFAEARALGDDNLARSYVSTAYCSIFLIGVALFLIILIINNFVDWAAILNARGDKADELKVLMPMVLGFLGLQLVLKLINSIYLADKNHSIQDKIQFYTQIIMLAFMFILLENNGKSLQLFGGMYMAVPVLLMIILSIIAFNGRYAAYRPSIALCKKQHFREINSLGLRFFIIQMAALVLFSTNNIVISHLFGPAEVVSYNIAFKYFSIITLCYGILIVPFWSSFTDAWVRDDKAWIIKSVSTISKLWIPIPFIVLIMIVYANDFYALWILGEVAVSLSLTVACGLYVIASTFGAIYVQFINGTGKIQIQFMVSIMVVVINIPLAVFLAKYLNWGASGVIISNIICMIIPAIIWLIQYQKLMNDKAQGIWAK